jgi:hypothetical protein
MIPARENIFYYDLGKTKQDVKNADISKPLETVPPETDPPETEPEEGT